MTAANALLGRTVVVTRPPHQAAEMIRQLEAYGAHAIAYPTVCIGPASKDERAHALQLVQRLHGGAYRGIIFTSANAVTALRPMLEQSEISLATLEGLDAFAIGEATAIGVRELGLEPFVAGRSIGEGMVETIAAHYGETLEGLRFLLPRAREGRMAVVTGLDALGASVDVAVAYATVSIDDGPPLPTAPAIDWLTFTSPSAAKAFARRQSLPTGARVAVIGPTTAEAVYALGLPVHVVPEQQSLAAMLDAMANFVG